MRVEGGVEVIVKVVRRGKVILLSLRWGGTSSVDCCTDYSTVPL